MVLIVPKLNAGVLDQYQVSRCPGMRRSPFVVRRNRNASEPPFGSMITLYCCIGPERGYLFNPCSRLVKRITKFGKPDADR